MRLASLAVTALLATAAVAQPTAQEKRVDSLLSTLTSLLNNPLFTALAGDAKDLLALASTIATTGTSTTPASADDVFGNPVYSSVSLSNLPSSFSLRQMAHIDVTTEITKFIYEELLAIACPSLLSAVCNALADLAANNLNMMPSLNLIDSVSVTAANISANLDTTSLASGTPALNFAGSADALLNFVIFPSPFAPMNRLFDLLKVRLMPIASVTYLGASGSAFSSVQSLLGLKVSGEAITVTQAFESIMEYTDANGNGVFDYGEPILQNYTLYDNPFKTARFDSRYATSSSSVYSVTSTTLDNVVTFSCDVSSSPVASGSDQTDVLTPAATGCKIQISNFPFKSNSSGLAMTGYIASAVAVGSAHAAATANVTVSGISANSISIANIESVLANATAPLSAYANWNGYASAAATSSSSSSSSSSSKASASASAVAVGTIIADVAAGSNPIGIAAKFVAGADASGSASASAKSFIYSLTSAPAATVTWSTSVGVGSTKVAVKSVSSAAAPAAPAVGPVAAAIAAAAAATGAMML